MGWFWLVVGQLSFEMVRWQLVCPSALNSSRGKARNPKVGLPPTSLRCCWRLREAVGNWDLPWELNLAVPAPIQDACSASLAEHLLVQDGGSVRLQS